MGKDKELKNEFKWKSLYLIKNSLSTKLHVLFLCSWYPSRVLPSNGDFIQRHARAVALKHQVTVIHIVTDPNKIDNTEFDIVEKENISEIIAYIKPTSFTIFKWYRFWSALQRALTKVPKYDVVHVHRLFPMGIMALYLRSKYAIPFIISEHWTGYQKESKKHISLLEKIISKSISKKAEFICPVSDHLGNAMKNKGLKGKFIKVPNVVDTKVFYPKPTKQKTFKIVHISDMNDEHKNIRGMLKVAHKLKEKIDFQWYFVGGDGRQFEKELAVFKDSESKVEFISHIPHKDVSDFLNKSDVFVLFSNYENLPCVVLEAFACGVPVISTNVGGIKEYFPQDFGVLIARKDVAGLMEVIEKIYVGEKKFERQKMHDYAIQHFSPLSICNAFTELYLKAIKSTE